MQERSKARSQALHILYQAEMTGATAGGVLAEGSWNAEDGVPSEFCRRLLLGYEEHSTGIDETISGISENWTLSRMPFVDRNILRLAAYEILFEPEIPDSVSINEAVELAKTYGGEDSSKFVNGVLGRLAAEQAVAEAAEGDHD